MNSCNNQSLNVILITIDSLSAMDMSMFGYNENTTPRINEFSKKCYIFNSMYSNSNSTYPCLYSILTGRYPLNYTFDNFFTFFKRLIKSRNAMSILKKKGYQILLVVAMRRFLLWLKDERHYLRPINWNLLFKKTFDTTYTDISLGETFKKTYELLEKTETPFFLWLHIYPPHEPYLPSERFKGYFLKDKSFIDHNSQKPYIYSFYPNYLQPEVNKIRSRYNEQILDVDFKIGEFINLLENEGFMCNTVIIITSDHGEMFEKGFMGHGGPYLYNPLIRIPLIIYLPDNQFCKLINSNAQQVDILPTILDILGITIPQWIDGRSLKFEMNKTGEVSKPVFSTNICLNKKKEREVNKIAVIYDSYKLIYNLKNQNCELYNLYHDPSETQDVSKEEIEKIDFLKHLIKTMIFNNTNS